jgi:hypothetical protein
MVNIFGLAFTAHAGLFVTSFRIMDTPTLLVTATVAVMVLVMAVVFALILMFVALFAVHLIAQI